MSRTYISNEEVQAGIRILEQALNKRLAEKGPDAFVGKHEILGIIAEEYHELVESIKNDDDELKFSNELMDIAVAAVFGCISLIKHKKGKK